MAAERLVKLFNHVDDTHGREHLPQDDAPAIVHARDHHCRENYYFQYIAKGCNRRTQISHFLRVCSISVADDAVTVSITTTIYANGHGVIGCPGKQLRQSTRLVFLYRLDDPRLLETMPDSTWLAVFKSPLWSCHHSVLASRINQSSVYWPIRIVTYSARTFFPGPALEAGV